MNTFHRLAIGGALSLLPALTALAGAAAESSGLTANVSPAFAPARSTAEQPSVATYYWFDDRQERHPFTPGNIMVSTADVEPGFHSFHAMVTGNGVPSWIETAWFVKTFNLLPGQTYTTELFIDGRLHTSSATSTDGNGGMNFSVDLNDLPIGVHLLMARVLTPEGVPTSLSQAAFLRVPSALQLDRLRLYYLIDGVPAGDMSPTRQGDIYSLNLDLASLPSGLHSISSFLAGADGFSTSMETAWFLKIPVGGEGVKSYEYWLNDDMTTLRTVELDRVTDPLEVVTLLDMPVAPFCSSRYAFAIEKGVPVTYARNDYQIRFRDLDGRFAIGSGSYTDVRVRQEAEIAGVLMDNDRTEVKNLADNELRFYTFSGQTGDSIGIRLDGGAMWELYGPDGATLMERSGAEAEKYSSMTLTDNGLYYLAVHDIAARYRNSVNVIFDHIARHAIIDFTPDESADDNLLIVNIHGNGFSTLKDLYLRSLEGDIKPSDLSITDNYRIHAIFDLAEKRNALSDYRIVSKFDDEEKGEVEVISAKTLSLAEADDNGIAVSVYAPFIAQTPYHINIIVENRSNVPYFGIPLNIAAKDMSAGTKFETLNFVLARSSDDAPSPFYHVDDLLGSGESGIYMPLIIPYLAPKESITYTIGLTSKPHEIYTLYTYAGTPWSEEIKEIEAMDIKDLTADVIADKTDRNWFSVYDIIKIYSEVMSETGATDNLLSSAVKAALSTARTSVYAAGEKGKWAIDQRLLQAQGVLESCGITMGDDIYTSSGLLNPDAIRAGLVNVAGDLLINAAKNSIDGIGNAPISPAKVAETIPIANRYHARTRRPSRTPKKGTSYQSGDPNDMHGYQSPAGSNYVGIDVKEVRYTIEFENDPEIANAPASRIDVENTIDLSAYDAASLTPVSLRLGNKEIDLPAAHHFVRTLDMRPEISAIAELTFDYEPSTGLSRWSLRSLDPLTMDETPYMDSGILPVNDDSGRGTGYLTYSVNLLDGLADGTVIANMATITFDDNDPIDTPVWENILDYKRPEARVVSVTTEDNVEFEITVEGADSGSGIWYYDLYARSSASGEWTPVMTVIEDDTFTWSAGETVTSAEFAIVAMDRAANRGSDAILNALAGDADGNGAVDTNDLVVIISYYMNPATVINAANADVNRDGVIDTQDATGTTRIYLDGSGRPQHKPQRKYNRK